MPFASKKLSSVDGRIVSAWAKIILSWRLNISSPGQIDFSPGRNAFSPGQSFWRKQHSITLKLNAIKHIHSVTWKHDINTGHVVATDLFQAIDSSPFLPNLNNIFRILLTMPVSAASCERSFSTLRRLKTWLRNTMGNDRLSSLALLYIHQDIEVCLDKFLEDFDDGSRRIKLWMHFTELHLFHNYFHVLTHFHILDNYQWPFWLIKELGRPSWVPRLNVNNEFHLELEMVHSWMICK